MNLPKIYSYSQLRRRKWEIKYHLNDFEETIKDDFDKLLHPLQNGIFSSGRNQDESFSDNFSNGFKSTSNLIKIGTTLFWLYRRFKRR